MKNIRTTMSFFALFLALGSCGKSGSGGYGSNTGGNTGGTSSGNSVSITSMSFSVGTLTITAGTTVTWTNNDNIAHTVTADDNSFDSGNLAPGASYSRKFTAAGTFPYHCAYHTTMKATVKVN